MSIHARCTHQLKIKEEIDEQKRVFNEERASVVVADLRESGSMFGRSIVCVIAS
ncbi:BZ3500_MvSof-1268-A1-R1_Chr4-2g06884 [Microbotryum saponariae]|uniref:BZ3500_MvSof-1268-A1-R1_Chr4-2g06884 protein n=1 Tax=Microbotryum saponariae TaxID=289078 RepID=A0A2X0LKV5_9BASI|nr:BZ3500_MvSof-1268-A1-R1_Chr4-2g06884 [Microbotryum saponariae]SDA06549.1 BZ3501_MvSof-1269-A2-R1_Chr4-2g06595 [Microbotryum saponariae]